MGVIDVKIEIAAPAGRVWDIVSDIDSEPRYWKGTKSVRNISKDGNSTTREITIAFRDQKCMQAVTIVPESAVTAVFTAGIIKGQKKVTLEPAGNNTVLRAVWDVRMTGVLSMFSGMISRHIKSGTEHALQEIKKEIESNV